MDYWVECIKEAFEESEITATEEQIENVACWVEGAHDNYSMSHGHDCISNPLSSENERLRRELEAEKSKILCAECKGRGSITIPGPVHSSTSTCHKCRGEGRA